MNNQCWQVEGTIDLRALKYTFAKLSEVFLGDFVNLVRAKGLFQ